MNCQMIAHVLLKFFLLHHLESVKCCFSKCRCSVELETLEENIHDRRQRRTINPKSRGPVVSLCRRVGADAALVKVFGGARTIGNKLEHKFQNAKVASAKVAFDTARSTEYHWITMESVKRSAGISTNDFGKNFCLGPEKGVITKGVLLEESPESLERQKLTN